MKVKQVTRYQVREYIGSSFSRQLGRRLRAREQAARIARVLKSAGREVFLSPLRVSV